MVDFQILTVPVSHYTLKICEEVYEYPLILETVGEGICFSYRVYFHALNRRWQYSMSVHRLVMRYAFFNEKISKR